MFNLLNQPATEDLSTRVGNLEAFEISKQNPGLLGLHFYAGGFVPPALATGGTDTTGIATQLWVSELRINANTLITGLSFLIGSVGGTDKVIVSLYDANGNLVANSALAGATVGTASTFQRVAFTAAYSAAPGLYYVVVSTNGTTAKIQTQAAGDHNCGVITGQVFGTLPATITPPSTFTAAKGPIVMTY
jgi:hypothetical protein